jgi:hypothetical protein
VSTRWGIGDPIVRRGTWRLAAATAFVAVLGTLAPLPWPESWWRPAPTSVPPTTSIPWTP